MLWRKLNIANLLSPTKTQVLISVHPWIIQATQESDSICHKVLHAGSCTNPDPCGVIWAMSFNLSEPQFLINTSNNVVNRHHYFAKHFVRRQNNWELTYPTTQQFNL
jgi:hypothetical protein